MATLSQNITQAISDLNSIKTAVENKGVTVAANTPTSQYATLIASINDDAILKSVIDGSITSIVIPNGITTIRPHAFEYCVYLTSVTIPQSVTTIGLAAFKNCYLLTSINIPYGVTSLGSESLWGCSSLTSLNLPNTITSWGFQSVRDCTGLTNVTLGSNWNCSVDFIWSTRLTAESLVGMLNSLADRTAESAKRFTVGATNLAKLTAEQIAIGTNKNWNLA